jgi:hypothetical protein
MGYGARQEFVLELLGALELMLTTHGHGATPGAGVAGAMAVYAPAARQGDQGAIGEPALVIPGARAGCPARARCVAAWRPITGSGAGAALPRRSTPGRSSPWG